MSTTKPEHTPDSEQHMQEPLCQVCFLGAYSECEGHDESVEKQLDEIMTEQPPLIAATGYTGYIRRALRKAYRLGGQRAVNAQPAVERLREAARAVIADHDIHIHGGRTSGSLEHQVELRSALAALDRAMKGES